MSRSLLLVAAFVLTPSLATAGASKAWTAAKKIHPDAPIIAGIDVASAKSSESFKKFFPILIKKKPQAQDALDRLQKECNFDPFVAINSIVAVIDNKNDENKGAFYIALNGWDAKKLGECGKKIAKSENKELKVGAVVKGIQEFSMAGSDDKFYLGWIGKDVLVFATSPDDRKFVESMMKGKGKGEASKLAKKLDTSATVWMSVIQTQNIQPGIDMTALYGTVRLTGGNMAADVRVVTGSQDQATKLVDAINKDLPQAQKMLPPAAKALVSSLKMTASGAEVLATTGAPEKDVLDLIQMLAAFM
jgi:hypothetical protein